MRYKALISWLLVNMMFIGSLFSQETAGFKKSSFYTAMSGNNADSINKQLTSLKAADIEKKQAYEGALQMKLAGLVGGPKKKLDLFKSGHKKLEAVLMKDSSNAELRFLRLMIQEHSPGILGYKADITRDVNYITDNFSRLPTAVQAAVRAYSKKSIFLHSSDL